MSLNLGGRHSTAIRRSIKDRYVVLVSIFLYSLLIAFWPYQADSGQVKTALACVTHAGLYIFLASIFSSYCKNPHFLKTPFAISCLITIVYLGVPFLKYYGEVRYVEHDVELHYRLLGLSVICASIIVILKLYAKKWILFYLQARHAMQRSLGRFLVPLMYCIFGVSVFYMITGGMFGNSELSAVQQTFTMSGYFIALYYFSMFRVQRKALWNELLFLGGGLSITYYTGQRGAVLFAILLLVFGRFSRIRSSKKRMSMVLLGLLITPLALVMTLGPLTEMTKARHGGVNLIFELQRVDFADFVAAASMADYKENVFTGLHTSLLWAMPGSLIAKESIDYSMEPFFKKNGWRSSDYREGYTLFNMDYVDSIFSNGAMVGGFAGALLFPLAWYGVFVIILNRLKKNLLLSFYLGAIPSMFGIEIAFWTIMPTLRNWFLTSALLFALIQLISARRLLGARVLRPRQSNTLGVPDLRKEP